MASFFGLQPAVENRLRGRPGARRHCAPPASAMCRREVAVTCVSMCVCVCVCVCLCVCLCVCVETAASQVCGLAVGVESRGSGKHWPAGTQASRVDGRAAPAVQGQGRLRRGGEGAVRLLASLHSRLSRLRLSFVCRVGATLERRRIMRGRPAR
jgi:hypothetical protein